MRHLLATVTLAALAAAPLLARAETIAIVGGDVYPVSGPHVPGGTVLMRNGTIVAVGAAVSIPAGARRVDARGKIVTPGFINAQTQVGLVEVGGERSTRNDAGSGSIAAAFRPWDGFFSDSAYVTSTREDGVTTIGIQPSGAFVAGQAAAMHLTGGLASEMLLRAPVAVIASVETGGGGGGDADETAGAETAGPGDDSPPRSRGEAFARLRELVEDARVYAAHRGAYDEGRVRSLAGSRGALDALVPVVQGRLPLWVQADRVDDIDGVLRLARELHLRVVLVGAAEGWRIAGRIAAARVPVLTGAEDNIPSSFSTLGSRQENAALLRRAGVEVTLIGNGGGFEDQFNARNIRYEAGSAVSYGMSHDDALRAVTLAPATALGVAGRVGSLRPGLSADVVVWSGDPFEIASAPEHVFVGGREFHDVSREDRLTQRYRHLPPDTRTP